MSKALGQSRNRTLAERNEAIPLFAQPHKELHFPCQEAVPAGAFVRPGLRAPLTHLHQGRKIAHAFQISWAQLPFGFSPIRTAPEHSLRSLQRDLTSF